MGPSWPGCSFGMLWKDKPWRCKSFSWKSLTSLRHQRNLTRMGGTFGLWQHLLPDGRRMPTAGANNRGTLALTIYYTCIYVYLPANPIKKGKYRTWWRKYNSYKFRGWVLLYFLYQLILGCNFQPSHVWHLTPRTRMSRISLISSSNYVRGSARSFKNICTTLMIRMILRMKPMRAQTMDADLEETPSESEFEPECPKEVFGGNAPVKHQEKPPRKRESSGSGRSKERMQMDLLNQEIKELEEQCKFLRSQLLVFSCVLLW